MKLYNPDKVTLVTYSFTVDHNNALLVLYNNLFYQVAGKYMFLKKIGAVAVSHG